MTTSMVEALEKLQSLEHTRLADTEAKSEDSTCAEEQLSPDDAAPTREQRDATENTIQSEQDKLDELTRNPEVGNPISHGQILEISRNLKLQGVTLFSLDVLLRGSKVYIAPPKPKAEPTPEYKALMARLRREEEIRAYERMINPPPPMETFNQRFPTSSAAYAFSSNHETKEDTEDDLTYADVDRQITLILNVLVSVVACAGGIWVIARWWSTPARLAVSMLGSLLVGVAEVVVYMGYIRRIGDAKGKAKKLNEVKEVINTWVVGAGEEFEDTDSPNPTVLIESKPESKENTARQRKKDTS
ncbi:hypothetical protein BP6252_09461 [Coleophoma cylindrospora]|uniref:Vacuolar h+-atpase assembly protein n=1 Tax=Coleophoma cylindrospora TaxID=1849047 RepID=A0A3D8R1Y9_9HELO|nr:hypothetical protein BP6252_09461 [Coleophoma cylindrospora]